MEDERAGGRPREDLLRQTVRQLEPLGRPPRDSAAFAGLRRVFNARRNRPARSPDAPARTR